MADQASTDTAASTQAMQTNGEEAMNGLHITDDSAATGIGVLQQAVNGGEHPHPDAQEILRQVEYYFSDENLPKDTHLLKCCGGRENLPVSISRICGFSKMRKFKKRVVTQVLRTSAFLDVSEDGKTLTRKVPMAGLCALDPEWYEQQEDVEIAYDPRSAKKPAVFPVPLIPNKKAEYPPGLSKNMMKPTGFEDTYVEPPLKPEEAEEEMSMYHPDKPFVERIEIAIQRFKQKRRMHEMYAKIFNKWMLFGGVESSPRMFGGVSKQEMAGMDAEEITRALATHNVPWDRQETQYWTVDFVGVGEAFLSSYYPAHYGYTPQGVKCACQVLRSFYNYLLFHSVCDEYRDRLLLARTLCDQAETEMSNVYAAGLALPGAFNKAASTIFGGSWQGTYIGNQSWAMEEATEVELGDIGMRNEQARVTFLTGVATYGTDAQYDMVKPSAPHPGAVDLSAFKIVKDESLGLEVVSIIPASEAVKELYVAQNEKWKNKLNLEPVGKLICKSWHTDDFHEYDLPKDKYPQGKLPVASEGREYEFWVEDSILTECFEGMKMDGRVLTLDGGMTILDSAKEVMCSFFKWLPNELWVERKPREVRILKKGTEGLEDDEEKVEANGGQQPVKDSFADDSDFED
ncbi:Argonaute siRNA chaperone complex subunit Arb1-domain-containing protein [Massariosphaeria phaeospora]|uniref:Argonaute siRNA chaperone complex subunit Arb1-domain-containing protein n=1 Tax=Massariosphaeria phaeospora TaxID=100035 RepID=A0A7C8I8N7_9PLEO|nr:Argonaute siRNA chaperone complex subunit Arb1-domain-containing protein [Massariosphaeria phaeospora]